MLNQLQQRVDLAYHDYLCQQEQGVMAGTQDFLAASPSDLHAPLATLLKDHAYVVRALRLMACRLAPGVRIGDYLLLAEVGRGGVGVVWEAVEALAGRRVALKVLRGLWQVAPGTRKRFEALVRAAARVNHPGIVRVFDLCEQDEVLLIAQEFVPGGRTLAREIQDLREGRATLPSGYFREVAARAAAMAEALAALHQAGVVHGWLKPSNVLLTPEGAPKVGDMGLAILHDEPRLPVSQGDPELPYYTAPEQVGAAAQGADARADVFSLGAVLYEMLTLCRPFAGETLQELAGNIQAATPVAPHRLRPQVPRELSAICRKAMAKSPERRYSTMERLAADLRSFLQHETLTGRAA
ncbi:MAG: serine/threonine protein kinase [Planctomycetota bacterium]|nr:MAG: serine/threonine protein kinase [Planctomycetota bacterium]